MLLETLTKLCTKKRFAMHDLGGNLYGCQINDDQVVFLKDLKTRALLMKEVTRLEPATPNDIYKSLLLINHPTNTSYSISLDKDSNLWVHHSIANLLLEEEKLLDSLIHIVETSLRLRNITQVLIEESCSDRESNHRRYENLA